MSAGLPTTTPAVAADESRAPLCTPSNGTFIDLFAGCGGFSLGLMQSGWKGLFAVEKDPHAFATISHNLLSGRQGCTYAWPDWLPRAPIEIQALISHFGEQLAGLRGSVDLLVGGPPCQGFSFAGKRKEDDERNKLVDQYLAVVELVQPGMIILENVRGIDIEFGKSAREDSNEEAEPKQTVASRIRGRLEQMGYLVHTGVVRAKDYGVPQTRARFILIGIRRTLLASGCIVGDPFEKDGLLQRLREPFLSAKGLPLDKPVTVAQAISDLLSEGRTLQDCADTKGFKEIVYRGPRSRYQKLMHREMGKTPPNSLRLVNHRELTRARFRRMHAEFRKGVGLSPKEREALGLKKNVIVVLRGDRPSHTLTTLPDDYLHYCEARILTVRENARLQSFPDWFAFQGKYTTGAKLRTQEAPRYTQVGNAVPPLVAEVLGLAAAAIHEQVRAANLAALVRIFRALRPKNSELSRIRIPDWRPEAVAA